MEEERGGVPSTLCRMRLCIHRRNWEIRLSEHRGAVKRNDTKNGIAVHAWKTQHKVDWDAATVKQVETNYVRRRTIEAIHIK